MKAVCRLCLKLTEQYEPIDDDTNVVTNRKKIFAFLPDVVLDIDNCVLCLKCSNTLQEMHELKTTCLKTEETIGKYLAGNYLGRGIDFVEFVSNLDETAEPNAVDLIPIEFVQCGEGDHVNKPENETPATINVELNSDVDKSTVEVDVKSEICEETIELIVPCDDSYAFKHDESLSTISAFDECKPTRGMRLKCDECDMIFASTYRLRRHRMSHKKDCDICGKVFKQQYQRKIHMADVHGCMDKTGKHQCNNCNARFITENALLNHLLVHNNKKGYNCDVCGKELATPKLLRNHQRYHNKGRVFECEFCHMKFLQKNTLVTHIRCHTGEKPYKCERCGKGFAQSGTMYTHIRDVHINERRYTCHLCPTKFKFESSLRLHIDKHNGTVEKKHICTTCGKAFLRAFGLRKHMLWHANVKNYMCVICAKRFVEPAGLKRHVITHTGEKPHQCHICEFRCNQKSNLTIHMKSHGRKKGKK